MAFPGRRKFSAAACLLVLVPLAACHHQAGREVYAVEGTVERIYPGEGRMQIAHDEIRGYMEPMTMDFDVKDPAVLAGLQPGDRVKFDLVVTQDAGWIENVRRVEAKGFGMTIYRDMVLLPNLREKSLHA